MGDFAACVMEWSNNEGNNDHSRVRDSCWVVFRAGERERSSAYLEGWPLCMGTDAGELGRCGRSMRALSKAAPESWGSKMREGVKRVGTIRSERARGLGKSHRIAGEYKGSLEMVSPLMRDPAA